MTDMDLQESSSGLVSPLGFPQECWPALVESLLVRPDMYVAMTDSDWRVRHVNPRFAQELSTTDLGDAPLFLDTLVEDSASALRQLQEDDQLEGRTVELSHRAKGGIRTVAYDFRRVETGWLGVGRDQSVEFELVSQMAVLVEDLEAKIHIEQALGDELRALVGLDPLTGLANRRQLESVLNKMTERFVARSEGFAVLCVDMDHFKKVNDTHGHLIGDEVLRRVANVLNKSVRGGDSAARYGGEEFVLVINTADVGLCGVISERIRRAVETAPMPEPVDHVTVSVGAACTQPGRHDMAHRLLELADQALYAAKQNGRNCVCISEESLAPEERAETEQTDAQPAQPASGDRG